LLISQLGAVLVLAVHEGSHNIVSVVVGIGPASGDDGLEDIRDLLASAIAALESGKGKVGEEEGEGVTEHKAAKTQLKRKRENTARKENHKDKRVEKINPKNKRENKQERARKQDQEKDN